ncbi:aldo/keto reductase [Prosthecobacter sp.]|uniref:aldo/keto reductase n=1 Tax=Prosthecobacter sp. TaxID=1965333 RepID=UPI002AB9F452|nr:aldo/keto reductase [Prosthecobacter sp.]MDZ4401421.1 aldo/keto reductase [Prosthecobacter sp.]
MLRPLARSGIGISAIAFGGGPVSGLMTADSKREQLATVERAIIRGINWFDTAATYGAGQSERSLGDALAELHAPDSIHVATKVRLAAEDLGDIKSAVKRSVTGSLQRLRRERVTLLQLHNAITRERGDAPTSITVADVLGKGGVLEAFEELRTEGVMPHFGLTGLGQLESLREVLQQGAWATIQVNEHALIRRAPGPDHLMTICATHGVAVLAIRVFGGGALSGQPPSAHTLKTPFFPLHLYERDQANARQLANFLPEAISMPELAIRHVIGNESITTAIIGFASPQQVDDAIRWAAHGPLPRDIRDHIAQMPLPEETP